MKIEITFDEEMQHFLVNLADALHRGVGCHDCVQAVSNAWSAPAETAPVEPAPAEDPIPAPASGHSSAEETASVAAPSSEVTIEKIQKKVTELSQNDAIRPKVKDIVKRYANLKPGEKLRVSSIKPESFDACWAELEALG